MDMMDGKMDDKVDGMKETPAGETDAAMDEADAKTDEPAMMKEDGEEEKPAEE